MYTTIAYLVNGLKLPLERFGERFPDSDSTRYANH